MKIEKEKNEKNRILNKLRSSEKKLKSKNL